MNKIFNHNNLKRLYIVIIFLFILNNNLNSQVKAEGKEFWFSFIGNLNSDTVNHHFHQVSISAKTLTSGTIEVPEIGWSSTFTINADTTIIITLPLIPNWNNLLDNLKYEIVHILSTSNVDVTAFFNTEFESDATSILPVNSLSNSYCVMTYTPMVYSFSEFCIVAINDNTQIKITPATDTYDGHKKGIPYDTILNTGQAYQVLSKKPKTKIEDQSCDLTGSFVTSFGNIQPFALFAGNNCTHVPIDSAACNQLFEQMLPIDTWGTEYITVPFMSRLKGDFFRVLASKDNTIINIDGVPLDTILKAGEFHEFILTKSSKITGNFPFALAQFSAGEDYDKVDADPFYIILNPTNQLSNDIYFNTYELLDTTSYKNLAPSRYYINVVTKTIYKKNILLDDNSIEQSFIPVSSDSGYSYAQIKLNKGEHRLYCLKGSFFASLYAYCWADGFGLSLMGFTNPFTIVDTLSPKITLLDSSCNSKKFLIKDNFIGDTINFTQQVDSGIKSIELIDSNNIHLVLVTSPKLNPDTTYYAFLINLILINPFQSGFAVLRLIDNAGNTIYDTLQFNAGEYKFIVKSHDFISNNSVIPNDTINLNVSISSDNWGSYKITKFNYIYVFKTSWMSFLDISSGTELDNSWIVKLDSSKNIGDSTYLFISGSGTTPINSNSIISCLRFIILYDSTNKYYPNLSSFTTNFPDTNSCFVYEINNGIIEVDLCEYLNDKFTIKAQSFIGDSLVIPNNTLTLDISIFCNSWDSFKIYNFNYVYVFKTSWMLFKDILPSPDLNNSWSVKLDSSKNIGDSTYLYISGKGTNPIQSNSIISRLNLFILYDNANEYLPRIFYYKTNLTVPDICQLYKVEDGIIGINDCGYIDNKFTIKSQEFSGKNSVTPGETIILNTSIICDNWGAYKITKFHYTYIYKADWLINKGVAPSPEIKDSWLVILDSTKNINDSTYLFISGMGINPIQANSTITQIKFYVLYDNTIEYIPNIELFGSNVINNDSCLTYNIDVGKIDLNVCAFDIMQIKISNTNYYLNINPNPSTSNDINLQYGIGLDSYLKMEIYNTLGDMVKQVYNKEIKSGEYRQSININDLSAGIYYIRIASGPYIDTKKIIVVK